jgi:spermidine synthase
MPEFADLDELQKFLNGEIKKALVSDVVDVARDTMSDHVMSDVYNKYTPSQYQRTGDLYKDIKTTLVNDNTLTVEDTARDNDTGRLIAPIVESGTGYQWTNSRIYNMQPFPREFVKETYNELSNGKAKNALANGLKKQGIDVV